jgi:hypothetical protein
MPDDSFLETIRAIPWFQRCGEPLGTEVPLRVRQVGTWPDALIACSDPSWEDTTLEARNILTVFLHSGHMKRYREWNAITAAAKAQCVLPLIEGVWRPFADSHGLGKKFVDCIAWDVLAAIMEHEYRDIDGRPTFFQHLLSLYAAGHFPCGWRAGDYPDGELLVL